MSPKSLLSPFTNGGRMLAASLAALSILIAVTVMTVRHSHRFFLELTGEHLKYLSADIAARLDADSHAVIASPEHIDSEAYATVTRLLEREQDLKSNIRSAYTLRIIDGEVLFIVVPPADLDGDGVIEGPLEERQPIFTPYGQPADPEMIGAAIKGEPTAGTRITRDRWGKWLSGCAPIVTSDGRLDGAVCVDEDARPILAHMRRVDMHVVLSAVLVAAFAIMAFAARERTRMEKQFRISAERDRTAVMGIFQSIFKDIPNVPMRICDRSGRLSMWNKAAERTYGYTAEEAAGADSCSLLLDSEQAELLRKDLELVWKTGTPAPAREWRLKKKDGGMVDVRSAIMPIVHGGEVVEAICADEILQGG